MAPSDARVRAAKPTRKQFKLYDQGGLFLIVKPSAALASNGLACFSVRDDWPGQNADGC